MSVNTIFHLRMEIFMTVFTTNFQTQSLITYGCMFHCSYIDVIRKFLRTLYFELKMCLQLVCMKWAVHTAAIISSKSLITNRAALRKMRFVSTLVPFFQIYFFCFLFRWLAGGIFRYLYILPFNSIKSTGPRDWAELDRYRIEWWWGRGEME